MLTDFLVWASGVSLLVLIVNMGVYNILILRLLRHMRSNLGDVWADLGKPAFPMNISVMNSLSVLSFLISKKYLRYEDAYLVSISRKCRTSLLLGIVAFGLILVLGFIGQGLGI